MTAIVLISVIIGITIGKFGIFGIMQLCLKKQAADRAANAESKIDQDLEKKNVRTDGRSDDLAISATDM